MAAGSGGFGEVRMGNERFRVGVIGTSWWADLEAGLHVICEKPLAMNVTLAREMAARAEAARRKTLTFFTHRTVAAAAQVKRMVDEGFLGEPLHVSGLYFTASHLRENKPFAW